MDLIAIPRCPSECLKVLELNFPDLKAFKVFEKKCRCWKVHEKPLNVTEVVLEKFAFCRV
jgi:hypothetical protein